MAPRPPRLPPSRGKTTNSVDRAVKRAATPKPNSSLSFTGGASQAEQYSARMNTSYQTAMALQEARESGDDSELLPYQPTSTINPGRPRTLAAGYDRQSKTMRVRFRDGTPWCYYKVTPQEWRNFQRVKSPGRAINRTFNNHPYSRGDF